MPAGDAKTSSVFTGVQKHRIKIMNRPNAALSGWATMSALGRVREESFTSSAGGRSRAVVSKRYLSNSATKQRRKSSKKKLTHMNNTVHSHQGDGHRQEPNHERHARTRPTTTIAVKAGEDLIS